MHSVARNWREAPLSSADQSLCEYAAKLTHHQDQMSPQDLDVLRQHGFDDQAIHDSTQVIAYFNYINRIAEALGVEPESFIDPPWGSQ